MTDSELRRRLDELASKVEAMSEEWRMTHRTARATFGLLVAGIVVFVVALLQ